MSRCKSCDAEIIWLETASGRRMPCDPARISVVTSDGRVEVGHRSHFATCPNAAQHRKPR